MATKKIGNEFHKIRKLRVEKQKTKKKQKKNKEKWWWLRKFWDF